MTDKGKEVLDQATVTSWGLIQQILPSLSDEEKQTLIKLLEKVREKAFECSNPGGILEEINVDEQKYMAEFMTKVTQQKVYPKSY